MERHCAIKRYTMKHVCGPSCKKYATAAQKAANTARCRHRFFRFYRILRPQQTLHLHLQSAEELDALHPHNKLRGFKLHGRKVVRKGRQGGYRHIFPGAILTKVRDIVLGPWGDDVENDMALQSTQVNNAITTARAAAAAAGEEGLRFEFDIKQFYQSFIVRGKAPSLRPTPAHGGKRLSRGVARKDAAAGGRRQPPAAGACQPPGADSVPPPSAPSSSAPTADAAVAAPAVAQPVGGRWPAHPVDTSLYGNVEPEVHPNSTWPTSRPGGVKPVQDHPWEGLTHPLLNTMLASNADVSSLERVADVERVLQLPTDQQRPALIQASARAAGAAWNAARYATLYATKPIDEQKHSYS